MPSQGPGSKPEGQGPLRIPSQGPGSKPERQDPLRGMGRLHASLFTLHFFRMHVLLSFVEDLDNLLGTTEKILQPSTDVTQSVHSPVFFGQCEATV